jgi:prevent-host-death family protein
MELMAEIGMHEAKTTLSKLVERAQSGEEIVLTKNGTPVARIEPVRRRNRMAEVRGALGEELWIAEDFDELPDDIAEAFGMR